MLVALYHFRIGANYVVPIRSGYSNQSEQFP